MRITTKIVARVWAMAALVMAAATALAVDVPDIENYGLLPTMESMVISPDGRHYAFIRHENEDTFFVVVNTESDKVVGGLRLSRDAKSNDLYFVTDDVLIFRASETTRGQFLREKYEYSAAYAYTLSTKKAEILLTGADEIYENQSGLGGIVGANYEKGVVYMPAWSDRRGLTYDLFRVRLDNGRVRRHKSGRANTIDWWVDGNGEALAREDFDSKRGLHTLFSYKSGKPEEIFREETELPRFSVVAVSADESALLITDQQGDDDAVFELSLEDGSRTGPYFHRDGRSIDYLHTNLSRKLVSVVYSGLRPEFDFVDDGLDAAYTTIADKLPGSSVRYITSTADQSTHLFGVSGQEFARGVIRASGDPMKLTLIGKSYPGITNDAVATIQPWEYEARDGLKIPSVVTWPLGVTKSETNGLPLVVMPHGGPASHDSVKFDWWAQALASRGYLVLQPNFRGSTGFGADHIRSGHGEWGKRMQDDVTDGVKALVAEGIVDPKRVCIVGASYGGYSALAGGAFTPDMYRCVVAVAPVADIPTMLNTTARLRGRSHWVNTYWRNIIGDRKSEREKLKAISPVNFASQFEAPVLLLHGRDDTVVPPAQSKAMHRALRKAKKPVDMVWLTGEDHWLSDGRTRLEMLKAVTSFLAEHNPI